MKFFNPKDWEGVLGMNARNERVQRLNPPEAAHLVNSKVATKERLEAHGIPVAPNLAVVGSRRDLSGLGWGVLPDEGWALKPDFGRQGAGILLAAGRDGDGWRTFSGRHLSRRDIERHVRDILDGEYSPDSVMCDRAMFEPLIVAHPALGGLVPCGLPDLRVISEQGEFLMAMARLPTERSGGRANLHQGAIGAAIDPESGRIVRAMLDHHLIEEHPDTGIRLAGAEIPRWSEVLEAARRCGPATGLGYLGVDVVVDAERGPVVLEVNARPGLEIQNVAGMGLFEILGERLADKKPFRAG